MSETEMLKVKVKRSRSSESKGRRKQRKAKRWLSLPVSTPHSIGFAASQHTMSCIKNLGVLSNVIVQRNKDDATGG